MVILFPFSLMPRCLRRESLRGERRTFHTWVVLLSTKTPVPKPSGGCGQPVKTRKAEPLALRLRSQTVGAPLPQARCSVYRPLRSDLRTAERRRPQSLVGCDLCLPRKSLALKTDQVLTLSPETSPLVLHQLGCVFLRSLLVSLPALHLLAKTPGSLLLCSIGNMSAALLLILLSIEPKVLEELDRLVAERAESSTPQSSIPQFRVWTCPLCQRLQSGASD